ncbi:YceI family protein [Nocardia sp. NBC_00565]|uniref:YceI family protein n=1 Tax=Nocardia sp. NBC_00565 TaxID=2975993 RepID=UPI002E801B29|nr:YceI family protein [Nocardia sp. NBC_00565]WUC01424.1 YceI family protein [Nocardia sp. NBC_00565]
MTWTLLTEPQTHRGQRQWMVDPAHSRAEFTVANFGRTVHGRAPIRDGRLTTGPDGAPEKATGTVDLGAIDTTHAKRDRDLRGRRLLDLDRHPLMAFTTEDITDTAGEWRVVGTVRVRGRRAELVCTVSKFVLGPGDTVRLVAHAVLDRREIGIRAPELMIGRYIAIELNVLLRPESQAR